MKDTGKLPRLVPWQAHHCIGLIAAINAVYLKLFFTLLAMPRDTVTFHLQSPCLAADVCDSCVYGSEPPGAPSSPHAPKIRGPAKFVANMDYSKTICSLFLARAYLMHSVVNALHASIPKTPKPQQKNNSRSHALESLFHPRRHRS